MKKNRKEGNMEELIKKIQPNCMITIEGKGYICKTKTWYTIEEDETARYIKCELSNHKVLVVIPDDELIYIGSVIDNMNYKRVAEDEIVYNGDTFHKTGEGNQYIVKIEFGEKDEVEGKCIFEDYECGNTIISLGILTEKNNQRADVLAQIISKEDILI